jgi:hypothetical protein
MKTALTLDTLVFQLIWGSSVRSLITGSIYKGEKSVNSTLEDVVVGTIAVSPDEFTQRATCNINFYVPDLNVTIGGVSQKVQDRLRLESLSNLVINLFPKVGTDYIAWIGDSPGKIFKEVGDMHYANIRIEFNFTN